MTIYQIHDYIQSRPLNAATAPLLLASSAQTSSSATSGADVRSSQFPVPPGAPSPRSNDPRRNSFPTEFARRSCPPSASSPSRAPRRRRRSGATPGERARTGPRRSTGMPTLLRRGHGLRHLAIDSALASRFGDLRCNFLVGRGMGAGELVTACAPGDADAFFCAAALPTLPRPLPNLLRRSRLRLVVVVVDHLIHDAALPLNHVSLDLLCRRSMLRNLDIESNDSGSRFLTAGAFSCRLATRAADAESGRRGFVYEGAGLALNRSPAREPPRLESTTSWTPSPRPNRTRRQPRASSLAPVPSRPRRSCRASPAS